MVGSKKKKTGKKITKKKKVVRKRLTTKKVAKKPEVIAIDLKTVSYVVAAALVLVVLYNTYTLTTVNTALEGKVAEVEEANRPAKLNIIRLVVSNCQDCFDLEQVVSVIKKGNVEITDDKSVDSSSPEGIQLIQKHSITKLPSIIISGETDKEDNSIKTTLDNLGQRESDGTVVFDKQEPPYVDMASGETKGLIKATIINYSNCTSCPDLTPLLSQFEQSGIKVSEKITIDANDAEGRALITKYNIEKIPTLLLSKDASVYSNLKAGWSQYGTEETDGTFIMRTISAPYLNVSSGEIVGLVELISISDASCTNCYDVAVHKTILPRFGISPSKETELNVTNATDLIEKYNITKVPTILLSPDTSVYTALTPVWAQVGSIEDDGWYVFRVVQGMGTYKDLSTGEIVEAQQPSQ